MFAALPGHNVDERFALTAGGAHNRLAGVGEGGDGRVVRSDKDVEAARRTIARIGRLSDSLARLGPFGLGVDGILAWIPGIGELYSLSAAAVLLTLAVRIRAPLAVFLQIAALLGLRSLAGAPASALLGPLYPLSGLVVDLFRAHKWSADLLIRTLDKTTYVEAPRLGAEPAAPSNRGEVLDRTTQPLPEGLESFVFDPYEALAWA